MWESSGEFGVRNVGEDVGNVTFDRGVWGGFSRTGRSELAPVIFPPDLACKGCCISNKVEMIGAGGGGKGEAFGKDRGFRGGEGMAGEIDDRDNLGGVRVVHMVRGGAVSLKVEWIRSGHGGWNLRGRRG